MYIADSDDVPCRNHDAEIWFPTPNSSKRTDRAKGAVPVLP